MPDKATVCPTIWIEEQRPGYVRYRNDYSGQRWEVHGTCDRRGDCIIGSVIDGVLVRDRAHLIQILKDWPKSRLHAEMDTPVTPEFDTCCGSDGTLTFVELTPVG